MALFTFADNSVVKLVDINTNKNIAGGFPGDPTTEFLTEVLQPNEPDDVTITLFQFIKSDQDPFFYIMTASGQFLYTISDALNPDVHKVTWAAVNPLSDDVVDKTGFLFSAVQIPNGNPNQPLYHLYSAVVGEGNLHLIGNDLLMAVPPNPLDPDQVPIQIEVVGKGEKVKGSSTSPSIGGSSNPKIPAWVWVVLVIVLILFLVLLIFIVRSLYIRGLASTTVLSAPVYAPKAPAPLVPQVSFTPPPPRPITVPGQQVTYTLNGQPQVANFPPQTAWFQDTRQPVVSLQKVPNPTQPTVLLGAAPGIAPMQSTMATVTPGLPGTAPPTNSNQEFQDVMRGLIRESEAKRASLGLPSLLPPGTTVETVSTEQYNRALEQLQPFEERMSTKLAKIGTLEEARAADERTAAEQLARSFPGDPEAVEGIQGIEDLRAKAGLPSLLPPGQTASTVDPRKYIVAYEATLPESQRTYTNYEPPAPEFEAPQDVGPAVPNAPENVPTALPPQFQGLQQGGRTFHRGGYTFNRGGRQYYVAPKQPRYGGARTQPNGFPYMVPSSQPKNTSQMQNNNNRFNKPLAPSLPWTHTLSARGGNPYAMRGGSLAFRPQ